ncbi:DUF1905 domain-containing protein [Symbioplanes lichenis]|uniref:DUF1905 domain-containing protein n=1 Tax=Symbioplanes lichenis TaxID=1629072 RepID=UPI00273880D8|nr:DUF1905 domain-containing protein [Actinoplanes lichenis]
MYPFAAGTRFRAELRRSGDGSGFDVPDDVVAQLGGGRPRVVATVNGHRFRTVISRSPRGYWLGVSPWRRAAARVTASRAHDVDVELDLRPS